MKKHKKHKWKYRINLRKKILVLVILGVSLFVGLGYAALETSLGIAGIFTVGGSRISVSFDNNINLLEGLDDVTGVSAGNAVSYDVSNGVVTLESNSATGYGYTDIKANLVSGKTYIFNCETDGEWAWKFDDNDAVYGFLGQVGNDAVELTSNKNFEFTVEDSGEYKLRIDVHEENGIRRLWNLRITEKNETTKYVIKDHAYGALPEVTRSRYSFKGWTMVPDDYQEVEYIESTAGNYIATDYYANSDTKIEVKYNFTSNKNFATVYGARGGNYAYMLVDGASKDSYLYSYYGNSESYYHSTSDIVYGRDCVATTAKGITTITNFENFGAFDNSVFQMEYPLYLFTFNESNSVLSDFLRGGVRIYYMKIYENDILVKNYVPVIKKSSGEAGLLDTITNTFYGNSGSGSFIVGDYANTFVTENDIVEVSSDHMLTAVWQLVDFTVTFDANGGSIPAGEGWSGSGNSATKDVTYGMQYGALPTPTKEGYTFKEWGIFENKYQQVEYVENTASGYIDTGVKMDSNKAFEIMFKYTSPTNRYSTGLIVGAYDGTVNANALSFHQTNFATHTVSGSPLTLKRADTTNTHVVIWNAQTNKVSIDGEPELTMSTTGSCNNTWYLFGENYNDGLDSASQGRIYYMKIYDDGVLIKDFVPAVEIDTGIVGLYDKVNRAFHPGLGGVLNAGNVVTDQEPLGYISVSSEDIMGLTYDHTLTAKWIESDYTVTLDANGGSIPTTTGWTGSGNTATKKVTYNSTYGELPVPIQTGYTFKGWNGKNRLNVNNGIGRSTPSNTTWSNATRRILQPNTYVPGLAFDNYYRTSDLVSYTIGTDSIDMVTGAGYGLGFPVTTEPNKEYTLSYSVTSTTLPLVGIIFYKSDGTVISSIREDGDGDKVVHFTTPSQTSIMAITFTNNGTAQSSTFTKINLEEGTNAGRYEPYYIKDTSTVVQGRDHTLTAKWQED